MSVTNYIPDRCRYANDELENVVYLVSQTHVKNVHIDNGEAYIDGLTEPPTRITGFNLTFNEETSLDERYKFTKSVSLSVNGYANLSYLNDRYYVILKSKNGVMWMVNIDFPSKVTYRFDLSQNANSTTFTFASQSNFPTLRVADGIIDDWFECKNYAVSDIRGLKLLETCFSSIDEDDNVVYTYGKDYQDVDFLGKTLTFTETFDGSKVSSELSFNILLGEYKSSWHYNLLEFLDNLYTAIIETNDGYIFAGFNFGLQPGYRISTSDSGGAQDVITVNLVESSNHGSKAAESYSITPRNTTHWAYVDSIRGIKAYECTGLGTARYLLKQEINENGCPTGQYMALDGYVTYFSNFFNVVDSFSTTEEFINHECGYEDDGCTLNTNMPNSISFSSRTCYSYTLSSSCPWSIEGYPSYISVSPSQGNAGTQYTVQVCNTKEVTGNEYSTMFVHYGNKTKAVDIVLEKDSNFMQPSNINISYLAQSVMFTYNSQCPVTLVSATYGANVSFGNGTMTVSVPANKLPSTKIWYITVRNCQGGEQTVTVTQDGVTGKWVPTSEILCIDGDSYVKEVFYINNPDGSTTRTDEYRAGSLIQEDDSRCSSEQKRWSFYNNYYCINGQKVECWEEEVRYGQGSWSKTGVTKLGSVVEDSDHFCDQEATYEWRQSIKWQCGT